MSIRLSWQTMVSSRNLGGCVKKKAGDDMIAFTHFVRLSFLIGALSGLVSCASLEDDSAADSVVFALGSREGFQSPLTHALKPSAPAIEFSGGQFQTTAAHDRILKTVVSESEKPGSRMTLAGYAKPGLPPEYARVLSEKRAHAVRHRLIELGLDPGQIQTAGYGNDFPKTGPTNDVVVIYRFTP